MKNNMRRASIQLSINFLVVLIICIVLFGIGLTLINKFITLAKTEEVKLNEYKRDQLEKLLLAGSLIASYPRTDTISKGEYTDFGIGISNELGKDETFVINIAPDSYNPLTPNPPEIIYDKNPYYIRNNDQKLLGVRIKIPKNAVHGTYIFNVFVCNMSLAPENIASCNRGQKYLYGDLLKLQVDVR